MTATATRQIHQTNNAIIQIHGVDGEINRHIPGTIEHGLDTLRNSTTGDVFNLVQNISQFTNIVKYTGFKKVIMFLFSG